MTLDLHESASSLAVSFAHVLIGLSKRVLLRLLFCLFLHVLFVYNTRHLMSQMAVMKKNLTNLGLNPGHMVRLVPNWVDCCMA